VRRSPHPSRVTVKANISTSTAVQPSRAEPMAPSTGIPIRDTASNHSECPVCHGPDGEGSSYPRSDRCGLSSMKIKSRAARQAEDFCMSQR
jgi:hypothetical protein